ncbi:MAG: 4Fe-4S dicluster domain-containing protein [Chloroflexi bacterium]|nr:4Fe-4S dicluster domain-containing protein [Chloroflexota bacterium]
MTTRGLWQVNNNDPLGATRDFLRALLDQKIVAALLVPMHGARDAVMPALVKHSSRLDRADPFAPVMAFNSARLVAMLTRESINVKIGVVLRACEIRALIELVKFHQAKLDNTVIIGVDCFGTLDFAKYQDARDAMPDLPARFFAQARNGNVAGLAWRDACATCEYPTPAHADIAIGFIGIDNSQMLVIETRPEIAEQLDLHADSTGAEARNAVLANLITLRTTARDETIKQFHDAMRANGGAASYFANCLECTNCMNACPICYCKECFFRTANAEHAPRELLRSAERHGALTMPPDAVLFQLTRLNHMATSCVGCGMCQAACPQNIPLTALFRAVGARAQKIFDYAPGRDVNEKPPFMEFRRDELLQIGESR